MPYPGRSWPTPPTKVPRRMAGIGEADQNAPSLEYHPNHLTILNLNEACTRGDLDSVKTQVAVWNTHLDPPPGPPGYEIYALEPVFYHAVEQGQGAIVSYFLDNGIHLCRLALYKAIGDEVSITVFHAYLDHGWDINNDTPGDGVYGLKAHPLGLLLSESNNHELVSWFLAHGADPNAVYGAGRFGQTNFTWAIQHNSLSIIKLLHQHGGQVVAGILPWAIRGKEPEDLEIVRFLLDIGAPIDGVEYEHDARLEDSYRPFSYGSAINRAVVFGSDDMVELLLPRGARTDIESIGGQTCLGLVREDRFSKKAEMILKHVDSECIEL